MEIQKSDRKVGMECFAYAFDWPVAKKEPITKMMPVKGVLAERPDFIGHKDGTPEWFIPHNAKGRPMFDSPVRAASLHIYDNMKEAMEGYCAKASARDRAIEQKHGIRPNPQKSAMDRKGPYTIYYGEIPLSVPITDRRRAELGFRTIKAMNRATDERRQLMLDTDAGAVAIDNDSLRIMDAEGRTYSPNPDLEWEGSREEQRAFESKEYGRLASLYPGRSEKEIALSIDPPQLCYIEGNKYDTIVFLAPETCSYDKATEMQNFLRYGMAEGVRFERSLGSGTTISIGPENICVLDLDLDPIDLDDEPEWAKGQINQNVAFLYGEADRPENIDDLEAMSARYHVEDAFAEIDEAGGVDRLLAGKRDEMDELADGLSSAGEMSRSVSRSEMDDLAAGLSVIDESDERKKPKGRDEMVQDCYDRMDSMTYSTLAEKAGKYFDLNSTMPGEKHMKEVAMAQREAMRSYTELVSNNPNAPVWEWNRNVPDKYAMGHKEFVQAMSQIVVKEVKLSSENRPIKTVNVMPFDEMISKREPDQRDAKCSVHSFPCSMHGQGTGQELFFSVPDYGDYVAVVPKGFATNHPNMAGMEGAVTASDYSKGKGGMSAVTFAIDLMQEPGPQMRMFLDKPSGMDGPGGPDDDFTKAINRLSSGETRDLGR